MAQTNILWFWIMRLIYGLWSSYFSYRAGKSWVSKFQWNCIYTLSVISDTFHKGYISFFPPKSVAMHCSVISVVQVIQCKFQILWDTMNHWCANPCAVFFSFLSQSESGVTSVSLCCFFPLLLPSCSFLSELKCTLDYEMLKHCWCETEAIQLNHAYLSIFTFFKKTIDFSCHRCVIIRRGCYYSIFFLLSK